MTATMQAYAVTLVFADGSIFSSTAVAQAREVALASAVQQAARDNPAVPGLTGFAIIDLPAERLREILRQIEGPGQVVSLVSDNLRPAGRVLNPGEMTSQDPPPGFRWGVDKNVIGSQPTLEPIGGDPA